MELAILTSIRPRHACNILNLIKLWEIRRKFPKDYVGWVYIYMCQDHKRDWYYCKELGCYSKDIRDHNVSFEAFKDLRPLNAKVIARFWCDRVDEILSKENGNFYTNSLSNRKLLTQSCLTQNELRDYMAGNWKQKFGYWYGGYAIHITKLEVFDKPKSLSEFWSKGEKVKGHKGTYQYTQLQTAPQSWRYVRCSHV